MADQIIHHSNTHGIWKTREYNSWISMIHRVTNPNSTTFSNYGGRGITICDSWLIFENFLADMGPRPADTSIDRIDNTAGYFPSNCRWATRVQQNRNQRTRIDSTTDIRGVSASGCKWKAHIGINGKQKTIGRFDTIAEAAKARKEAEEKYWE